MAATLLHGTDARALMRQRIDCRAYWIIPFVGLTAAAFSATLEECRYSGAAASDFEAMLVAFGGRVLPVAFAKKARVGPRALARLMVQAGAGADAATLGRDLLEHDVLVIPDDTSAAERARVQAILLDWNAWLYPGSIKNWWN